MADELYDFSIMTKTSAHLATPNAKYRFTRKHIENIKSLRVEAGVNADETLQLAMLKKIRTLELLGGFSEPKLSGLFERIYFERLTQLAVFPWDAKKATGLNKQKNLKHLSLGLLFDLPDLEAESLNSISLDLPEHPLNIDLTKMPHLEFVSLAVGRTAHKIKFPKNLTSLSFQSFTHNHSLNYSRKMDPDYKGVTFDAKGFDFTNCCQKIDVQTNRVVLLNLSKPSLESDPKLSLSNPHKKDFAQIPPTTKQLRVVFEKDSTSFLAWQEWSKLELQHLELTYYGELTSAQLHQWLMLLPNSLLELKLNLNSLSALQSDAVLNELHDKSIEISCQTGWQVSEVESLAAKLALNRFKFIGVVGPFESALFDRTLGWQKSIDR